MSSNRSITTLRTLDRHAIVIGIEAYLPPISPLRYAEKDASCIYEALKCLNFNTILLVGSKATREGILDAIKQLSNCPSFDQFLLFFAGHGIRCCNDYYLLPAEADTNNPSTCISLSELFSAVGGISCSECIFLLDAWHNKTVKNRDTSCDDITKDKMSMRDVSGIAHRNPKQHLEVLFGCSQGECCWEDPNLGEGGRGVFANFLLKSLDQALHNQKITFQELADTTGEQMTRWRGLGGEISQQAYLYRSAKRSQVHLSPGELMENEIGMQFRRIKGGVFHMGASSCDPDADPDEKPAHDVILTDFYMGVFPVTRGQFAEFVKSAGYLGSRKYGSIDFLLGVAKHRKENNLSFIDDPSSDEILRNIKNWLGIQEKEYEIDCSLFDKDLRETMIIFRDLQKNQRGNPLVPIIQVSYEDADEFCRWLTSHFPGQYMLPTEAQWEFCCRAGTTTRFSWGDDPNEEYANFGKKKVLTKQEAYPANRWGLFDMHGSVWELCRDLYHPDYYKNLQDMSMNPLQTDIDYTMIEKISKANDTKKLTPEQWLSVNAAGGLAYEYTTKTAIQRVVRGGSCASLGKNCRSSQREIADNVTPVGFRCIWVPDEVI